MNSSNSVGNSKITIPTVVLAKAEWECQGISTDFSVKPIPESWYDCRENDKIPKNVIALVACPKCKNACAIMKLTHVINNLGKIVHPRFECPSCKFTAEIYLDKFHVKPLYAIALENGHEIVLQYTHASSVAEASHGVDLIRYRIIGIGPAIGYHVLDKKGMVLGA